MLIAGTGTHTVMCHCITGFWRISWTLMTCSMLVMGRKPTLRVDSYTSVSSILFLLPWSWYPICKQ
jgi:hypothetical protein